MPSTPTNAPPTWGLKQTETAALPGYFRILGNLFIYGPHDLGWFARTEIVKLVVPLQGLHPPAPLVGRLQEDRAQSAWRWGVNPPHRGQRLGQLGTISPPAERWPHHLASGSTCCRGTSWSASAASGAAGCSCSTCSRCCSGSPSLQETGCLKQPAEGASPPKAELRAQYRRYQKRAIVEALMAQPDVQANLPGGR